MSDLRTILVDGIEEGTVLNSMYEIEDVLLLLNGINKKLEFYKALKRYRTESIDSHVSALGDKSDILRQVVRNTMRKLAPDEKTVNFPAIGKVSRRKAKDSWVIEDQNSLSEFLDEKGIKDDVVRVVESLDKRKLNTALDRYSKSGVTVPGVSKLVGEETLSITFEKEAVDTKMQREPAYASDIDLDELDTLI